jgi:hypothetical protein
MEHSMGLAIACSARQVELQADSERAPFFQEHFRIDAEAFRSIDSAKCQALFQEFRKNGTWQVPTITVRSMWSRLDDGKFTSDPRLAYVGRQTRERWDERTGPIERRWTYAQFDLARQVVSAEQKLVGLMFRSGVPIMAGTDAGNPYCFPGFSLHDELARLVESGLTPLGALQAATIGPAKFMGRAADLGTVEPGKAADLVLLGADPLADIHNTGKILGVWLEGKYFDQAALKKLLDDRKREVKH